MNSSIVHPIISSKNWKYPLVSSHTFSISLCFSLSVTIVPLQVVAKKI